MTDVQSAGTVLGYSILNGMLEEALRERDEARRERDEARRQASVWEKLASMSDSALNDWCVRHDLHGCLDGDCGERRCIWCGEEVYEVLDEITKQEEANETL